MKYPKEIFTLEAVEGNLMARIINEDEELNQRTRAAVNAFINELINIDFSEKDKGEFIKQIQSKAGAFFGAGMAIGRTMGQYEEKQKLFAKGAKL